MLAAMTTFALLVLLLSQPPMQLRPLTPIEKAQAWELVRVELRGDAQQCGWDVVKNPAGEGLLVVCGGPSLDALSPSPMVFLVIDGKAYAASIYAGAMSELPDVSMNESVRTRAGLGLFNEMEDRREPDGSIRRTFARYPYDPRPLVCSSPYTAPIAPGAFVPAQPKRLEPALTLQREITSELVAFERRGRVLVQPLGVKACSLAVDEVALVRREDDEYEGQIRIRVFEADQLAYEETLTASGEEIKEVADSLAKDLVKFISRNYLRLKRRGAPLP